MKNKRIVQLDGLRFIGIFLVMVAHWLQWQWSNPVASLLPFSNGVILFFVLSGFLISRILFYYKEEHLSNNKSKSKLIKRFYIRRCLRIFPIYYLFLLCLFFLNYQNTRELSPWLFSYSINFNQVLNGVDAGNFIHFWSLAAEEQFYLFWPFIILLLKPSKTFWLILLIILFSVALRLCLYYSNFNNLSSSFFTIINLDALGLGAILAYIEKYKKNVCDFLTRTKFIYFSLVFYVIFFILAQQFNLNWFFFVFDPFIFSIMSMFIILKASKNGFQSIFKFILENKFIVHSGKISYALYIFHLFIPGFVYWLIPETEQYNSSHPSNKYILFVVYYIVCFALAHLSWNLIESPINKFKNKFPY